MPSPVDTVLEVLKEGGYERLPQPLVVGGAAFKFEGAARGTDVSHDLIIVAPAATDLPQLARLVSGLSRMLDQVESRRPLSLILLGEDIGEAASVALEDYARVMIVNSVNPTPQEVREVVAILMPLNLPTASAPNSEPLAATRHRLRPEPDPGQEVLIDAAVGGADAVREALRKYLNQAATHGVSEARYE